MATCLLILGLGLVGILSYEMRFLQRSTESKTVHPLAESGASSGLWRLLWGPDVFGAEGPDGTPNVPNGIPDILEEIMGINFFKNNPTDITRYGYTYTTTLDKRDIVVKIDFELANTYFDAEEYDKALKGFEEIMAKKNDFEYDAHLMIAKCHEKMGQEDKAGLEYLRLIKRLSISSPPKEVETETIGLKHLLEQITPLPQKKEELESQAHLGAGNAYRTKKEYRNAIVKYNQAIKKSPKSSASADAAFYIADIYDRVLELRDYERAVEAYTKVITDYPDSKWVDRAKERKKYIIDNYL